jgi:hypothetical protein
MAFLDVQPAPVNIYFCASGGRGKNQPQHPF